MVAVRVRPHQALASGGMRLCAVALCARRPPRTGFLAAGDSIKANLRAEFATSDIVPIIY